ncbi:hypothetical protein CVU76_01135 [Candidatus Dojkabacteria bacterium HGW-Dojkabacteria-1]|uniref:Glycosyltransferase 2-like domain-containing protein n=1 Tax=Candidatus Dojkabacteria bacterium HGW-Dojkabacteria-1 TaxID=2013761 RepID=A0A2N2F3A0_9BACT|nr:MAG: hypothetical protein CVU76_01135 [Candidatus Dojkabacteria bacterium HGW-Dojkabacteria-1]
MSVKKKEYKISVIIPCYNQGKFVDDAVDSVLKQTYQNFEIIIINDGSTDEFTNNLLKNYNKPNTEVYHTKNQGLASTRNYGFQLSTGDLIQFLDADDFLDERKFEVQIKEFQEDDSLDVSYTNYQYFYDASEKYSESQMEDKLGSNPFDDFIYKWQRGLSIPIHCGLFKKSIFGKSDPFIGGFKAIEDWIMWVMIAKKGCRFKYLEKSLAFYRIQSGNMTKNKEFMFYWVARAVAYIAENFIETEDSEKFNSQQEKYLKQLVESFYISNIENEFSKRKEEILKIHLEEEERLNNLLQESELRYHKLITSRTYRFGEKLLWLPKKIRSLISHQ